MTAFVLDASALIAMLKGEKGGDQVAEAISSARMCMINYAEVISHFVHAGMPPLAVDTMLDPLPIDIVPADRELARIAGHLRGETSPAGLSLGDRFCLSLAIRDGLSAWTSDSEWRKVASAIKAEVVTIR